jgi:Fe-S cluster assembly iron-binding protein IscA
MVILTDKAIEKFKEFLNSQNAHGIRLFVTVGG